MKTFYTVRDIEDMHTAGVTEIKTHDDVVLTDVAREKVIALGMNLVPVEQTNDGQQGAAVPRMTDVATQSKNSSASGGMIRKTASVLPVSHSQSQASISAAPADMTLKIKAAVVARVGTDKYNDLLDKIIPQVMSQLKK